MRMRARRKIRLARETTEIPLYTFSVVVSDDLGGETEPTLPSSLMHSYILLCKPSSNNSFHTHSHKIEIARLSRLLVQSPCEGGGDVIDDP